MAATAPAVTAGVERLVRDLCHAEGFPLVRFAPPTLLHSAREAALAAEERGDLADMAWMTPDWLQRATDPDRFLAGAQSLILLALPYHGEEPTSVPSHGSRGRVARYAWGRDYHRVFEKRLRRVAAALRSDFAVEARATVDYGPLLERPFAAAAGMGWLGKSTMLLAPGFGPWIMLGAIATTLPLQPDPPLAKSCGSCSRCVVSCPTGALGTDGGVLDSRLCISYHTIENRGFIPRELRPKFGNWVFGCDACLDSCPVGARTHAVDPDLAPASAAAAFPLLRDILSLDEEAFRQRFQGRAIMRAKRDGLVRNACVALGNVGDQADLPALFSALTDASPVVRAHAAWAAAALALRHRLVPAARDELESRLQTEDDAAVRRELELALDDLRSTT